MSVFDYNSIYDDNVWVTLYPNAMGFQDKFLSLCKEHVEDSEFPNVSITVEQFKTGGVFFNKEHTKMLCVSFTKSQFKKLGIFFRAQQFGNLMYFTLLKTVDKGFWDAVRGRSQDEVLTNIRLKCKNLAQWEEISCMNNFGNLIFVKVLEALDPDYKSKKNLLSMER